MEGFQRHDSFALKAKKGVIFVISNRVGYDKYLGLGLLGGLTAARILHLDERVKGGKVSARLCVWTDAESLTRSLTLALSFRSLGSSFR